MMQLGSDQSHVLDMDFFNLRWQWISRVEKSEHLQIINATYPEGESFRQMTIDYLVIKAATRKYTKKIK
jgi:hypothetical protein